MDGFERGRNLEKVGLHSQDTAELFFNDVQVPVANLLGEEGQGFVPPGAQPPAGAPVDRRRRRGRRRGRPRLDARLRQGAHGVRPAHRLVPEQPVRAGRDAHRDRHGQAFVDRCVEALNAGELTAEEAAKAKWWCTELQKRVVDRCLQLHGGYGYMLEYPIARAYADARITTIYGGTTEIMKEIIGRSLGV